MRFVQSCDNHLRSSRPLCRLDGGLHISEEEKTEAWFHTQEKQLQFIVDFANEHSVPIINTGDLFDRSAIPDQIINLAIRMALKVKKGFYFIPGNHDLLEHNFNNITKSSIGVLSELVDKTDINYIWDIANAAPFGLSYKDFVNDVIFSEKLLFIHELVFLDESKKPPNVRAKTAQDILDEYPEFDWIFLGDQHHKFHYINNGRHVVNPGCMNVQKADFMDYTCSFAFVDTEKETVEWIPIPDDVSLLTRDHITQENARKDRIAAFVEKIKTTGGITLDFADNIEKAIAEESVSDAIRAIVQDLMLGAS